MVSSSSSSSSSDSSHSSDSSVSDSSSSSRRRDRRRRHRRSGERGDLKVRKDHRSRGKRRRKSRHPSPSHSPSSYSGDYRRVASFIFYLLLVDLGLGFWSGRASRARPQISQSVGLILGHRKFLYANISFFLVDLDVQMHQIQNTPFEIKEGD
ncbi:hypothetical protein B296_00030691 [Ensete ventricosum]|uniref:Uncharacterized protein n=1 Tax=Ensete ventricosum TaxID=4639 RepID=A0A426YCC1_ENSVE|nr:hypothetical protein B296_00030691 [Ensete ventricosum]